MRAESAEPLNQHDDLVSLGKMIMTLCCEWFVPGQHPAAPLDHISRHYSPDVKNLVMYLCGKPPSGKSIDEVVSILGLRILNEFDAMQKWVQVHRRGRIGRGDADESQL